ncbi:PEPxxWA-CTERM sorting domain-containing protein [uncultured Sphingomonas sp.]|uniref:PEPxxWA-CTERM sorting domain-containing protein n=1 Tax=uncultured Sphingomonas sp. TaxID=158754 RepID=UPI0035CB6842
MKTVAGIAGAVLLSALGGNADAATTTIDFTDVTNGADPLNNRYTEDGYDFTGKFSVDYHWLDIRGDEMEPALLMDSEFNQFDITASGKQFALSSFDYAGYNSPRSNSITLTGYNGGDKVYTITKNGNYGRPSGGRFGNWVYGDYQTINVAGAIVDRISFVVNRTRQTDLDNFVLTDLTSAVPEPSTWTMMLMGFGMMGVAMRPRRRSTKNAYA